MKRRKRKKGEVKKKEKGVPQKKKPLHRDFIAQFHVTKTQL
jgi:hypothetical protein